MVPCGVDRDASGDCILSLVFIVKGLGRGLMHSQESRTETVSVISCYSWILIHAGW